MSAVTTNMNTFRVKQVMVVPGFDTQLALVALEDIGAILIDTSSKKVLSEFSILEMNPFPE